MIVWVASYPRSGNTMARMLLAQAFGCLSASEYERYRLAGTDASDGGQGASDLDARGEPTTAEVAARVGLRFHLSRTSSWEEFRDRARTAAEPIFIKTHGPPSDDGRAIYVVRDGRAAVMSFVHFLRHYAPATQHSVAGVIRGAGGFGSWSEHLDAWSPLEQATTLLLRFEDLTRQPQRVIDDLARFIGRAPVARWVDPFVRMSELAPHFFLRGANEGHIAEFAPADLSLFWEHHGAWMKRLGYGGPECSQ